MEKRRKKHETPIHIQRGEHKDDDIHEDTHRFGRYTYNDITLNSKQIIRWKGKLFIFVFHAMKWIWW